MKTEPGPWYSWPWYKKIYKYIRYQPVFKVKMMWAYLYYVYWWHREFKHIEPTYWGDRIHPEDDGLCVPPHVMWELTVKQDARELENYFTLVSIDE